MRDNEEQYLMLSGLQHFEFCRRQWALIHIEQQWEENVKTVEGQHLHRNADQPFFREKRGDKLIIRALPIRSNQLKLTGICDVIEFIKSDNGIELAGEDGKYLPYPIEYKRGKPKKGHEDIIQLAAQAMCLEEMLLCEVNTGFIYYHEIKHRVGVSFTKTLRKKVKKIAEEMHHYYNTRYTPKVKTGPHCKSCSLQNICLPKLMNKQTVKGYIERKLKE